MSQEAGDFGDCDHARTGRLTDADGDQQRGFAVEPRRMDDVQVGFAQHQSDRGARSDAMTAQQGDATPL